MQRDLTDSTVSRNIGMPMAHSLLAWKMLIKGLNKLLLNEPKLQEDLENNWVVVSEGIQTILRREGFPKPYEKLKELTRNNNTIGKKDIQSFISKLKVSKQVKEELMALSPSTYTGKSL